jgi:hypothetical protein
VAECALCNASANEVWSATAPAEEATAAGPPTINNNKKAKVSVKNYNICCKEKKFLNKFLRKT